MAKRQNPAVREAGAVEAAQDFAWWGEALVLAVTAALVRRVVDYGRNLQAIKDEFRPTEELLADTGASHVRGLQRAVQEQVRELDAQAAAARPDAQPVTGVVAAELAGSQVVPVPAIKPAA